MLQPNNLYLGDCLDLITKIEPASIDLIFVDLPFGVTNTGKGRNEWDKLLPMESLWKEWKRIRKNEATPIVLSAMQPFSSLLIASNPDMFKYEWIWRKPLGTGFLNAKKQPLRNHESVLVFYEKQCVYNPQMRTGFKPYKMTRRGDTTNYGDVKELHWESSSEGDRYPVSVLEFNYDKEKLHPTQKPKEYCEYFVNTYSNAGDTVLDCCMGSGSIPLAAKTLGRNYVGIEKEQKYYDIAVERLNKNGQ